MHRSFFAHAGHGHSPRHSTYGERARHLARHFVFHLGRGGHDFGGRGGRFGSGPFGGGGPFGGNFRGGPGMRPAKMLGSADLQLVILFLLAERPRHGYDIIKAIEEHSSGVYVPSPGMVYPALTFLEEAGFASASTEGTKKLFTITAEGAAHLDAKRGVVTEMWTQLARFGHKFARAQQQFAEDEDLAEHFASDPHQHRHNRHEMREEFRAMKDELRGLRDELKAAIFEKIDSSPEEKRRILEIIRRAVDEIRNGTR